MKRVTHRKEDKVYVDAVSAQCIHSNFCTNASGCTYVKTRECPQLKVLDTLADIEDKCEDSGIISLNHLYDVITYCRSVGIIDKVLKNILKGEDGNEY